jgi:hypothetical protein
MGMFSKMGVYIFVIDGSSRMVITVADEGRGVMVQMRLLVVWVRGGREKNGVAVVNFLSTMELEGESMHIFFRGKTELRTSQNLLPDIVVSSRIEENAI